MIGGGRQVCPVTCPPKVRGQVRGQASLLAARAFAQNLDGVSIVWKAPPPRLSVSAGGGGGQTGVDRQGKGVTVGWNGHREDGALEASMGRRRATRACA